MTNHTIGSSVSTSIITAFVALWPSEVAGYASKLFSVFLLAMVAEGGRRLFTYLFSKVQK